MYFIVEEIRRMRPSDEIMEKEPITLVLYNEDLQNSPWIERYFISKENPEAKLFGSHLYFQILGHGNSSIRSLRSSFSNIENGM